MKLFNKKDECLELNRGIWEESRSFMKAPFQERFQEMLEYEQIGMDLFND